MSYIYIIKNLSKMYIINSDVLYNFTSTKSNRNVLIISYIQILQYHEYKGNIILLKMFI